MNEKWCYRACQSRKIFFSVFPGKIAVLAARRDANPGKREKRNRNATCTSIEIRRARSFVRSGNRSRTFLRCRGNEQQQQQQPSSSRGEKRARFSRKRGTGNSKGLIVRRGFALLIGRTPLSTADYCYLCTRDRGCDLPTFP